MIELDHLHIGLGGMNLIEASAGTGKTYAVSCLYLRLLIEKDLLPEQILVVTFTEAATSELRSRIRSRIREAMAIIDGAATDDPFLHGLANNVNGKGPGGAAARQRLERALHAFDTAAIFTIHAFCLRALKENAFESGSLYDTELIADRKEFLSEIVDDFWRTRFFGKSAPLLKYALDNGYSPERFMGFLTGMLSNPQLEIIPAFTRAEIALIETNCRNSFREMQQEWQDGQGKIKDIILHDQGLSRAANAYRPDLLPGLFAEMAAFVAGDDPFRLFPGFDKFTYTGINKGKKAQGTAPSHRFFARCEELRHHVEKRLLALHGELISFCRERLPVKKQAANVRFFDDLLADLYHALAGERGDALSGRLREQYRAALIDEFQDTDPVQYDIFRKIFTETDRPLFLIGDPKQAIYSFRGADIFAYLKASADVAEERRFTLTTNRRSTPGLLRAFNAVFGGKARPFVFDAISYHPTKPGKDDGEEPEAGWEDDSRPFRIWRLPRDEKGEPLNATRANESIPLAVAAEIARLLRAGVEGKAMIEGRPLLAGDMAVIVRSHRQAGYIQDALHKLSIPSVVRSDRSVFAGEEARELCTLLNALSDPGNETKVRAALVTGILGRTGDDIARLLDDEPAWEDCLESFRAYSHTWLNRGFMAMAQSLMAKENIRGILLRRPDGERRLTNLLHCFEILHRIGHEQKLGREGATTWFGERVSAEEKGKEYEIRLETDEKAVKIVTVHVSKGLEYPVVFCPFLWGGVMDADQVVSFHEGYRMVKDFGSFDYERNRRRAQKEGLAESLRLLYVAVTRAKYRCYLCAGKMSGGRGKSRPETSSLAYIFHSSKETRMAEDTVASLADEIKTLSPQAMEDQLQALMEEAPGAFAVGPQPAALSPDGCAPRRDDGEVLSCKEFTGVIRRDWRVASFSSFAEFEGQEMEMPDRDELSAGRGAAEARDAEMPEETSIFTFPRGTQAGIFFHEIFEKLDYAASSPAAIGSLVEDMLAKHGYAQKWRPPVCSMVHNVIGTEFSTPEGTFSLSSLKTGNWVPEFEFFFPLKYITSRQLNDCLRKEGATCKAADMNRICTALSFQPVRGMVRGFMDMVFAHGGRFYLLDWKSNHLGCRAKDYGREAMQREMERHLYPLQYLLYTVALDRYLALRVKGYDYESHFGGVIYVFLRGVSSRQGENYGIFRDSPPRGLIEEMRSILIESEGQGDGHGLRT